jgi:seryl-tRNA synthetase
MVDIKFIREHPNEVKEGCRKKGVDFDLDRFLEVDEKRRAILKEVEGLRAQQKKTSTEVFQRTREGETLGEILGLEAQKTKARLKDSEKELKVIEEGGILGPYADDSEPSPSRSPRGEG